MTEEQRDKILLDIASKVDFNTKQIAEMNLTMSNHSIQITEMQGSILGLQESVSGMQEDIKEMKNTIEKHSKQIKENTEELVRQRQNIAKLEFDMSNKIDILFDAISMSEDKDLEYKKEFNSIHKVLDNLDKRVFILESKN